MVITDLIDYLQRIIQFRLLFLKPMQNWLPVQSNLPSPYSKCPFRKSVLILMNRYFCHCFEWLQNKALNLRSWQGEWEKGCIMNEILISRDDSSSSASICRKKNVSNLTILSQKDIVAAYSVFFTALWLGSNFWAPRLVDLIFCPCSKPIPTMYK